MTERIRKGRYFAYVRRQVWPDQAARVAALKLDGIGFVRRASARIRRGSRVARARLRRHRQCRAERDRGDGRLVRAWARWHDAGADRRARARSAASSGRRPRASLELTIDDTCSTSPSVSCARAVERRPGIGHRHGSQYGRDPGDGQRAGFQPQRVSRCPGELRRNRAIQDLYEPGSTFKIVIASAAFEERAATPSTIIDASAGNIRFGSARIETITTTASCRSRRRSSSQATSARSRWR